MIQFLEILSEKFRTRLLVPIGNPMEQFCWSYDEFENNQLLLPDYLSKIGR